MHSIWKGSISFGLVNIPIALYTATHEEELHFRLLRASDLSPVNYKRVAEVDGKEVPWDQIVKGYEYEKGRFVVLKDEDFKRVDIEATQTVDIIDFVELDKIDPMFFSKPYYMTPTKGGEKAYALLRDVLRDSGKVGIAKVVIKTRPYLASVEPRKNALVLELMHFSDELVNPEEFKIPASATLGKKEIAMGKQLVESMSGPWKPEKYHDDYREALLELIHRKVRSGGKELPGKPAERKPRANVIDLVSVLQKSIAHSKKGGGVKKTAKPNRRSVAKLKASSGKASA